MNSNQKTLKSYEAHIQEYINGTPQEVTSFVKAWIDETLGYAEKGATVLELGSAFGRDAAYIEQAGCKVERTDATQGFVDLLREQRYPARKLNAISDELGGPYDVVFADAVLLHFTVEEFKVVISKVFGSLKTNGIFAFTVKQGEGNEWTSDKIGAPRFFQYWGQNDLHDTLTAEEFDVLKLTADSSNKWWQVIARKSAK